MSDDSTILPPSEASATRSDPPNVKQHRLWSEAVENVTGMLCVMVGSYLKLAIITPELAWFVFALALGAPGLAQIAGRVTGRRFPGSLGAMLLAVLEALRHMERTVTVALAAFIASQCLMLGCVGSSQKPDWTVIGDNANALDATLNTFAQDRARIAPLIDAACAVLGHDTPDCKALTLAWDGFRAALQLSHGAVEVYRRTGAGLESCQTRMGDVAQALDEVQQRLARLGDVLERAGEGMRDANADSPVGGGGSSDLVPGAAGSGAPSPMGGP